jgi:hypothetical protein
MAGSEGHAAAGSQPPGRAHLETRSGLLRLDAGSRRIELRGRLACVRAPSDDAGAVADAIARATVGSAEPRVVDDALLHDVWQSICSLRRVAATAAHVAVPFERRPDAAITPVRERAEHRLQVLLDTWEHMVPVPSAEALRVASEFEFLLSKQAGIAEPAPVDVAALEARLVAAQAAVTDTANGLSPAVRQRVARCHHKVKSAEQELTASRRGKRRRAALARYHAALAQEREALGDAGVDSYTSFLLAVVVEGSTQVDLLARLRAEVELAQAEADLAAAYERVRTMTAQEHAARLADVAARAAALLGRVPGDDPVAELCGLRVEHPDAHGLREKLRHELTALGIDAGDDVVAAARATLGDLHAASATHPAAAAEDVDALDVEARENDRTEGFDARAEYNVGLAGPAKELAALDAQRGLPLAALDATDVMLVIATLFERHRAGELLAGRQPIVLDRALDKLDAACCGMVAQQLSSVGDVQIVVVTTRKEVSDAFSAAGVPAAAWPAAPEPTGSSTVRRPDESQGPSPFCADHTAQVAADCTRCGRGSCIACLVFVPGDPHLWCTTCAHAARRAELRSAGG